MKNPHHSPWDFCNMIHRNQMNSWIFVSIIINLEFIFTGFQTMIENCGLVTCRKSLASHKDTVWLVNSIVHKVEVGNILRRALLRTCRCQQGCCLLFPFNCSSIYRERCVGHSSLGCGRGLPLVGHCLLPPLFWSHAMSSSLSSSVSGYSVTSSTSATVHWRHPGTNTLPWVLTLSRWVTRWWTPRDLNYLLLLLMDIFFRLASLCLVDERRMELMASG